MPGGYDAGRSMRLFWKASLEARWRAEGRIKGLKHLFSIVPGKWKEGGGFERDVHD